MQRTWKEHTENLNPTKELILCLPKIKSKICNSEKLATLSFFQSGYSFLRLLKTHTVLTRIDTLKILYVSHQQMREAFLDADGWPSYYLTFSEVSVLNESMGYKHSIIGSCIHTLTIIMGLV